jgi:hypothetical protein
MISAGYPTLRTCRMGLLDPPDPPWPVRLCCQSHAKYRFSIAKQCAFICLSLLTSLQFQWKRQRRGKRITKYVVSNVMCYLVLLLHVRKCENSILIKNAARFCHVNTSITRICFGEQKYLMIRTANRQLQIEYSVFVSSPLPCMIQWIRK